jgi:hypothetical protein
MEPGRFYLRSHAREVGYGIRGDFGGELDCSSPADRDAHYNAIRRGFEEGDLTAPSLAISDMQLARAISEFTGFPPNEASIATLERRLNPQY